MGNHCELLSFDALPRHPEWLLGAFCYLSTLQEVRKYIAAYPFPRQLRKTSSKFGWHVRDQVHCFEGARET